MSVCVRWKLWKIRDIKGTQSVLNRMKIPLHKPLTHVHKYIQLWWKKEAKRSHQSAKWSTNCIFKTENRVSILIWWLFFYNVSHKSVFINCTKSSRRHCNLITSNMPRSLHLYTFFWFSAFDPFKLPFSLSNGYIYFIWNTELKMQQLRS